jgi:hypothetical protein
MDLKKKEEKWSQMIMEMRISLASCPRRDGGDSVWASVGIASLRVRHRPTQDL